MPAKSKQVRKSGLPMIQAARLLEIGENTLRRWITSGCPATKGKTAREGWRINIAEVIEWRIASALAAVEARHGDDNHISRDEADRRTAVARMIVAEHEAGDVGSKELLEHEVVESLQLRTLELTLAARNNSGQSAYNWLTGSGASDKDALILAHACRPILEQAICEFVNHVENDLKIEFKPSLLGLFPTLAAAADGGGRR